MYQQPNQPQLLGGFFQQAVNIPHVENKIDVDFNSLNQCAFKQSVSNIPNMNEHEIAMLVKNNIDEIAEDILSGTIPYINLFSNDKFIDGFVRGISSIPVNYKIRMACNKLTYDYFTSDNTTMLLKQKYLHISRVVNHSEIVKLMALNVGIDENTACNLTLCRYSSTNESCNVKRLNFALYSKDPSVMNEQAIVYVYEILFDNLTHLFNESMFEVYSPQEENDFGDNFMEIYGAVGLAILDIVNNMESKKIMKLLSIYAEEWNFRGRPKVRFTLRNLASDFSRITRVVEYLDSNNKYVP